MSIGHDNLPDDPEALKALLLSARAETARLTTINKTLEILVEALKVRIAKLNKQKYGASSEKLQREIEQLQLTLEDVEIAQAAGDTSDEDEGETTPAVSRPAQQRRRGKPRVSPDAPREQVVLDPGEACPSCGGRLELVGEDLSQILEYVAAKLKVVETRSLKKVCRSCNTIHQEAAPSRPVRRGMLGASLLAYILVAKFDDHLPLYRQAEIFARLGAEIPRSTLIDACGQAVSALDRLIERIKAEVMRSMRLHADDTPIRVLDPSKRSTDGKTRGVKEGRIWTYVRDDRPWGGGDPPCVAYYFSPDRKGERPQTHLADFAGILQADAYSGFRKLYEPGLDGKPRVREAACWAHLRRDFHDVWKATDSPIAMRALEQIGALYDVEREINGRDAEARRQMRQRRSVPLVDAFQAWCEREIMRVPGKGDLAKAMRYFLARKAAFRLFLDDGHVAIDNNAAERAIRPVVIGRKNYLFAGSDAGGDVIANAMTIIETAKLNGLNPEAYLADVLTRISDHKVNRLDELLPWNWAPADADQKAAA